MQSLSTAVNKVYFVTTATKPERVSNRLLFPTIVFMAQVA